MKTKHIRRVFAGAFAVFVAVGSVVEASPEKEKQAQELSTLFRSARKVISDNQNLINDPEKGDKGLKGKAVATQAKANYKAATGKDLPDTPELLSMLKAVEEVMAQAQPLINEKGKGFKGFLPAVFARQVASKFSTAQAGKITIKLTAPRNYLRNRRNRPDTWESDVIEKRFRSATWKKGQTFAETGTVKGKSAYRFMLPEYYGQSCLGCHGKPKGERDITGGLKDGGVLNELGGAISVSIFE